jgi:hypothetical protein
MAHHKDDLLAALKPIVDVIATLDLSKPEAARDALEARFPFAGDVVQHVGALFAEGRAAGWLCDRVNGATRFSRVQKADASPLSIDAVHMSEPGPGHTHGNGEVDLCFAVSGAPVFDGHAPGWTVYPPKSWHVPTVEHGVMDILYFLPGGAITFEPKPA